MIGYAGVDGTGSEWLFRDVSEYRAAFRESHVCRLHSIWRGKRQYFEGPKIAGLGARQIASRVAVWVSAATGKQGVVLAGYSRGGAAAIVAAQHLCAIRIPVHCLLLFDAVDRSPVIDSTVVPPNVAVVFHAMRAPATSSREAFGNCGLHVADKGATRYERKLFYGTHGAIGGVPWTVNAESERRFRRGRNRSRGARDDRRIYEGGMDGFTNVTHRADAEAAAQVWQWMTSSLRRLIPGSV